VARQGFKTTVLGIIALGAISGFIANQLGVISLRGWFNGLFVEKPMTAHQPQKSPTPGTEPSIPVQKPPEPAHTATLDQPNPILHSSSIAKWKLYKNVAGNFSVLFPSDPSDRIITNNNKAEAHQISVEDQDIFYAVFYGIWQKEKRVDEAGYALLKKYLMNRSNCEVGKEGPPSIVLNGYIGHSYHMICNESVHTIKSFENLYWGRRYFYIVMVFYPNGSAEPPTAKRFLESFFLNDKTK
jgi:hypothetical protein